MPVFYFHVRSEGSVLQDDEGIDLPDRDAAGTEAAASARDIVAERVKSGKPFGLDDVFEITDESGQLVLTVPFREAVPER